MVAVVTQSLSAIMAIIDRPFVVVRVYLIRTSSKRGRPTPVMVVVFGSHRNVLTNLLQYTSSAVSEQRDNATVL